MSLIYISYYRSARSITIGLSRSITCFVTQFAQVDAHNALTVQVVKDGLNFPLFARAFDYFRDHTVRWMMSGKDRINEVILKTQKDAEK